MSPTVRKRLWRSAAVVGTLAVLGTGLIGFAHTDAGRPLLAFLMGVPGCPAGMDELAQVDPEAVEAYRRAQFAQRRGTGVATSRAALGLDLGRATRADVESWATSQALDCTSEREDTVMRCGATCELQSDLAGAPPIQDLYLQFTPEGVLVAVDVLRLGVPAGQALAYIDSTTAALTEALGAPDETRGPTSATAMEKRLLSRRAVSFERADYLATISATHFGAKRQVVVREQYQADAPIQVTSNDEMDR